MQLHLLFALFHLSLVAAKCNSFVFVRLRDCIWSLKYITIYLIE